MKNVPLTREDLMHPSNLTYVLWVGFLLGAVTMLVQFVFVDLPARMALGEHFGQFIVHFFGFLTNLSNIWLALVYAAFLFSVRWLKILRDPRLIVSALSMITIVTLVYHIILLPDLGPATGIEAYTDSIKHYAVTVAFLLFWLRHVPHGKVHFRDLPFMTIPAVGYLVYVFIRGEFIHYYPYSVIDVTKLGYIPSFAYAAGVIAGFLVICIALIFADKTIAKRQQ